MSFKIIATTDVHGHLLDYNFINNESSNKGLSKLSSYLNLVRQNHQVIYIDNGDINQGTPLVSYANKYETKNFASIALNLLKCDYFNLGNHDFNFGSEFLKKYIDSNQAQCITSNIKYRNENVGASKIIDIGEHKIGLIGAVTDYIPNWESQQNLVNITIDNVFECIQNEVNNLKSLVDYVVVVYHGGFEKDLVSGEATENLTGENIGYRLCHEITGIDVLISGHQHRNICAKVNDTYVVQCNDTCNKCMEITFDNQITVQLVDLTLFETDLTFEKHFEDLLFKTNNWLNQKIGQLNEDLFINDLKEAQLTKHPITTLFNQIFLDYCDADIASCCLFDVMPGLAKELKYRDIILNAPFPNTLVVKAITGKQLLTYLNQLASYWIVEDDQITINPKFLVPKREVYNYDLLNGIEYTINVSKKGNNYVSDVYYKNQPLNLDQEFKLVVNSYRATGGGNFSLFPTLETLKDDGKDVAEVLISYFEQNSEIIMDKSNNIHLKKVE